jgi:hypothetical protein
MVGTLLAHRPARCQLPYLDHRVRCDISGSPRTGYQPLYLGATIGRWIDADGGDWKLPAVGTDCHCAVSDGPGLVCARVHGASELGDGRRPASTPVSARLRQSS